MQATEHSKKAGRLVLPVVVLISAALLAFLIRACAFITFHVTSGSMEPTLLVGDYLLVAKWPYGYSRYSIPLVAPPWHGRLFGSQPRRGDVVVFRYSRNDHVDYIKRIVGLPGDRIQVIDDTLRINDVAVKRERIGDVIDHDRFGPIPPMQRWQETLPNGTTYTTQKLIGSITPRSTRLHVVPEGHYFVIGDNRDNSSDSRDLADIGYVPDDYLVGRAEFVFHSMGQGVAAWQVWRWPELARFDRWFTIIR
jgi:signal peptidase I